MINMTITQSPTRVMEIVSQPGPVLALQAPTVFNLILATVGMQGPPGPSGSGSADTITAAEALGGHRVITAAGLHATNATIDLAIGITSGAASTGTQAAYVSSGFIDEPSWTWTPQLPIFIGASGVLTQIEPIGTLRQVGTAVTATRIAVNLRPTIYRG